MKSSKKATALTAALMTLGALVLSGSATQPAVEAAPLDSYDVQESVKYLVGVHGVTDAEAVRRLELQRSIPELQARLLKDHPDNYAGMWLDQKNGGVLVVGATEPDVLAPTLRALPDGAHVRTVRAQWSYRDLKSTAEQVEAEVGALSAMVDDVNNRVLVIAQQGKTEAIAARSGGKIVEHVLDNRTLPAEPSVSSQPGTASPQSYAKQCPIANCWPPMMGGYRLDLSRDNGSWGGCSTGFNVRGDRNGQVYVLTAGHCTMTNPGHVKEDLTYHNGLPVGTERGAIQEYPRNGPFPADYTLMPYQSIGDTNWADHWIKKRAKKNGVFVRCRVGVSPCQQEFTYISGMQATNDMKVGEVLCASGSADVETSPLPENNGYEPGTRCGAVETKQSVFFLVTDICSRKGDSGGPLFSQVNRKAYGILVGYINGLSGPCQPGKEKSDYSILEGIMILAERKSGNTAGLRVMDDRDNR